MRRDQVRTPSPGRARSLFAAFLLEPGSCPSRLPDRGSSATQCHAVMASFRALPATTCPGLGVTHRPWFPHLRSNLQIYPMIRNASDIIKVATAQGLVNEMPRQRAGLWSSNRTARHQPSGTSNWPSLVSPACSKGTLGPVAAFNHRPSNIEVRIHQKCRQPSAKVDHRLTPGAPAACTQS